MGTCIECKQYKTLEGRCQLHNWPKEHNQTCKDFDSACIVKKPIETETDIDEEDTTKLPDPQDQVSWMAEWIEKQDDDDD